jgi:hypothetical protein
MPGANQTQTDPISYHWAAFFAGQKGKKIAKQKNGYGVITPGLPHNPCTTIPHRQSKSEG